MYVVTVDFYVKEEFIERFIHEMRMNARASLDSEPGCRRFDVTVSAQGASHIFLYEIYDDEAAFQSHLATDHFKALNVATADWVREKRIGIFTLLT